jgi:hypothetical protein
MVRQSAVEVCENRSFRGPGSLGGFVIDYRPAPGDPMVDFDADGQADAANEL